MSALLDRLEQGVAGVPLLQPVDYELKCAAATKIRRLTEALDVLTGEAHACFGLPEVQRAAGPTNCKAIENAVAVARAALAEQPHDP